MFTLKLFKSVGGRHVTRIEAVHHVQVNAHAENERLIQLWAFHHAEPSGYDTYYIGEADKNSDAVDDIAQHGNHYGWGLLENWEGNTTQHFRPASYGFISAAAPREAA